MAQAIPNEMEDQEPVFKALADRNRRLLLDSLFEADGQTLNALCEYLNMSRQAVSKHLAILEGANLITSITVGRNKHHHLNPVPLELITRRWLDKFSTHQAKLLVALRDDIESASSISGKTSRNQKEKSHE